MAVNVDTGNPTIAGEGPPSPPEPPDRPAWRQMWIGLAIYAAAILVLFVAAATHQPALWLAAIVVSGVAAVLMHHWLRRVSADRAVRRKVQLDSGLLLVAVGALSLIAWHLGHWNGAAFAGVSTVFLGLGELMGAARSFRPLPARWGHLTLGASAIAFVVGFGLTFLVQNWLPVLLMGAGALTSPIGLGLASEARAQRVAQDDDVAWPIVVLGGAAALIGVAVFSVYGAPHEYLAVFLVAVVVVVAAIVTNTNADVFVVVAVAAVLYAFTPTQVPLADAVTLHPNDHVIVSLGDSYSSGEGAKSYFDNTNTPGINACRRSPTAYPANLGREVVFMACSGAVADQLTTDTQSDQEPVDWVPLVTPPTLRPGLPQLGSYQYRQQTGGDHPGLGLQPDLVVVGIGGNDAHFGDIVQTCIEPGDCSQVGDSLLHDLPAVLTSLDAAFQQVKTTFPGTPVLVVPYPIPIRDVGCPSSPLTDNEHRFLAGFTNALDDVQRRAAADSGFMYLTQMRSALADAGQQICQGPAADSGVNFVALDSITGNLDQTADVQNWLHDSMHPKASGQTTMAAVVRQWLSDHPDFHAAAEPPVSQPYQAPTAAQIMAGAPWTPCAGSGDACNATAPDWEIGQARGVFLKSIGPLLLLVFGTWLLATTVVGRWRRHRGTVTAAVTPVAP